MISSIYFSENYLHSNHSLFYTEYTVILTFLFIAAILSIIIVLFSYILAVQKPETEKLSTYECGFEPFDDARNTFDIRFYLVAILFILFDLEATFLFPWAVTLSNLTSLGFWSMFDFIFELVIGFIYAWKIGSLEWE